MMLQFEDQLFLCPFCQKSYRGYINTCPHCSAELRPKSIIPEDRWQMVQKLIKSLHWKNES